MARNGTPEALTAQQERALDHLLAGETITAAAQAVNTGRSTLHRWLREDPHFLATYNQRRRELQEAHQTRLASIATKALQTVQQAVENGDVATSMKLLLGLGLLPGEAPRIGPEDPRDVEKHLKVSRGKMERQGVDGGATGLRQVLVQGHGRSLDGGREGEVKVAVDERWGGTRRNRPYFHDRLRLSDCGQVTPM